MKRYIKALFMVATFCSTSLSALIITDYPDPFTYPGDPDYRPRRSYVIGSPYPPRLPWTPYDTTPTRAEAIERDFYQKAKALSEAKSNATEQQQQIDNRVLKQQEKIKERSIRQQELLNSR